MCKLYPDIVYNYSNKTRYDSKELIKLLSFFILYEDSYRDNKLDDTIVLNAMNNNDIYEFNEIDNINIRKTYKLTHEIIKTLCKINFNLINKGLFFHNTCIEIADEIKP